MQTPAPVAYERATTVDHALELLERLGPDSRLIAGGHSLLPMMKLRLARPETVIDINGLTDLDYIRVDGGELAIGAMTRHAGILDSPIIAEHYSIFTEAERVIADPIVRNRGTLGGSLCQGDPAEDLAAVASALKASVVVRSRAGTRTIPARELHTGPYETAVGPAEILTELRVPIRAGAGSAYEKVERRAGDWAAAAVGAYVVLGDGATQPGASASGPGSGTITGAGIGLTAVGAQHFCAPEAEQYLIGKPPTDEHLAEAARLAAQGTSPNADQRGPVDYKRHLAEELTLRALRRSVARAQGRI